MFYKHILEKCTKTYTKGDVFVTNENHWIIAASVNSRILTKIVECPEDLSQEKIYNFSAKKTGVGHVIKNHFATSVYNCFTHHNYLSAHL